MERTKAEVKAEAEKIFLEEQRKHVLEFIDGVITSLHEIFFEEELAKGKPSIILEKLREEREKALKASHKSQLDLVVQNVRETAILLESDIDTKNKEKELYKKEVRGMWNSYWYKMNQ